MNSLDIIRTSSVLQQEDFDFLSSSKDELLSSLNHAQMFRTRTEMETSVLDDIKRPTADSKYWQAIREQAVMFNELVSLSFEYKKRSVKLAQIEKKIATWTKKDGDEFDKQLLEIDVEESQWTLKEQERVAHHRIREMAEWSDIKSQLEPLMGFPKDNPNDHQLTSYAVSWLRRVQAGGLDTGSAPERINLLGQVISVLRHCETNGVLDDVLAEFPAEFVDSILQSGIGGESCKQSMSQYLAKTQNDLLPAQTNDILGGSEE